VDPRADMDHGVLSGPGRSVSHPRHWRLEYHHRFWVCDDWIHNDDAMALSSFSQPGLSYTHVILHIVGNLVDNFGDNPRTAPTHGAFCHYYCGELVERVWGKCGRRISASVSVLERCCCRAIVHR